ncbi:four helix bundle protein [Thermodesulfovibrionales bacterium]|nr:four helix bundle protein [Thermodesulfovibrionales bacterium]
MAKGYGFSGCDLSYNKEFSEGRDIWVDLAIRRAAVSVPSNIAEGTADRTVQQFSNFCPTPLVH